MLLWFGRKANHSAFGCLAAEGNGVDNLQLFKPVKEGLGVGYEQGGVGFTGVCASA